MRGRDPRTKGLEEVAEKLFDELLLSRINHAGSDAIVDLHCVIAQLGNVLAHPFSIYAFGMDYLALNGSVFMPRLIVHRRAKRDSVIMLSLVLRAIVDIRDIGRGNRAEITGNVFAPSLGRSLRKNFIRKSQREEQAISLRDEITET